jgi:tetratricopeptide (TPR) repeat protein
LNPLLVTPQLAIQSLPAEPLYFNTAARPWLLKWRPELLTPEDRNERSDRTRAFVQAVENPRLFRQLDRQYHFSVVLLCGDPSQYHPLVEHLAQTKDFALRYVDHTSLLFDRNSAKSWTIEDLEKVRSRFATAPKAEQITFLTQTATKLFAVRRFEEGKRLLDDAAGIDANSADVWTGLAIYHLNRGAFKEALTAVDRALALDSGSLPALATKTQTLYAAKRFSEAYTLSQKLIAAREPEPGILFYHAKIAHEAHAYKSEIAALEKLIAQARAQSRPISGYQLYLAQAYAANGQAKPAIDAFAAALSDPELPADQRTFARETMEQVKHRSGL